MTGPRDEHYSATLAAIDRLEIIANLLTAASAHIDDAMAQVVGVAAGAPSGPGEEALNLTERLRSELPGVTGMAHAAVEELRSYLIGF